MPLTLNCPRCKKPLSVPKKKAGSYINCVHCSGRLWIPKDAVEAAEGAARAPDAPPLQAAPGQSRVGSPLPGSAASSAATPPAAPAPPNPPPAPGASAAGGTWVPASPPSAAGTPGPPPAASPSPPKSAVSPPPVTAPPAAAQPPAPTRKVARFIAAEASKSTLKIAEDGQLPELRLEEGEKKAKKEAKTTTVNPLVLFGVIALSVVMSILLVLYEPASEGTAEQGEKDQARATIARNFFGDEDLHPEDPLKPYQQLLREASLAHERKNYQRERRLYRKVLDMLREESGGQRKLLTGDPDRDEELRKLITTILKGT